MRAEIDPKKDRLTSKPKARWERPRLRSIAASESETAAGLSTDILSSHS
jgi:hypothetical protein